MMCPMSTTDTPGNRITATVRASSLTQQTIADRLGITRSSVAHRMTGRSRWHLEELHPLADLLGVNVADLLGEGDE